MNGEIRVFAKMILGSLISLLLLNSCFKERYHEEEEYTYYENINRVEAIATNSMKKIITAAYISREETPTNTIVIVQYQENGDLDTLFGDQGVVWVENHLEHPKYSTLKILIAEDDKIILVESQGDKVWRSLVTRFNTDGSIDNSFGINGIIEYDFIMFNTINALANNNLLLAGTRKSSQTQFCIAQLSYDGQPDASFNAGEVLSISFNSFDSYCNQVFVDQNNKIFLTGYIDESTSIIPLSRLKPNGTLDTAFNHNGKVLADIHYDYDKKFWVRDTANGKYLLFGKNSLDDLIMVQINQDGSLDNNFGNMGIRINDYPFEKNILNYELMFQNSGNILMAGSLYSNSYDVIIIGIQADGTLNTGFGDNGYAITDIYGDNDIFTCSTIQNDGKIILAGEANRPYIDRSWDSDFFILRYNPDGSPDIGFGIDGLVKMDIK